MSTILQDVRYALRQLQRYPGFAATVILTMALGIGANSTVFGVIDALILRPLNLPQADELRSVNSVRDGSLSPFNSYPNYRDFRDRNSSFSDMAAYIIGLAGLDYANTTTRNWVYEASDNYFDLLRIKPYLGRFFSPADAHGPNSMPYAVIGYDYWRTRFNADPAVVGKVVQLDKHPFTVVGVAPPGFIGTEIFFRCDLWIPMLNEQQVEGYDYLHNRAIRNLFLIGRLKPGVTAAAATGNLNAVGAQLAKQYPENEGLTFPLSKPGLGGDYLRRPSQAFLMVVMALAALVLIAACANLAALFSARAGDRARELALRLALGSSRRRLLRQLVVESLVMSVMGGALGLLFGQFLLRLLSNWRPSANIPIQLNVNPSISLPLLALALSVACGVFFGLVPSLSVWRANAYQVIKQGSTGGARGRRLTFRDALLLLQVALCAILVTSSLVALRGLERSVHASYGFQTEGVTLATFDPKMAGYTGVQVVQFQKRVAEAAAQLPGVTAAAFASGKIPLSAGGSSTTVWREGVADKRPSNSAASPFYADIAPGFLGAARTRLLAGRDFTWHDDEKAPHVAIVNETFARKVFGTVNALGRVFLRRDGSVEVVGVVEDGKYENLAEDPTPAFFYPIAQEPDSDTALIVRSASESSRPQVAAALQHLFKHLDPAVPVSIEGWQQSLGLILFPALVATVALGTMGGLAAMLALTGIFGMASYAVSRRLRELGIRMALGAARQQILRAAIGRPVQILALGSLLGLVLGTLANKLLSVVVFEATTRDPLVLSGVVLSMALIGTLAAWLPARRALAIEPSRLLRED